MADEAYAEFILDSNPSPPRNSQSSFRSLSTAVDISLNSEYHADQPINLKRNSSQQSYTHRNGSETNFKRLIWNWLFLMAFLFTILTVFNKIAGSKVGGGLYGNLDCDQSLSEGTFILSKYSDKNRWRTNTCFFHYHYSLAEIQTCLSRSSVSVPLSSYITLTRIVMVGDGFMKSLFYTLQSRIMGEAIRGDTADGNLVAEQDGVRIEFIWDPFLNNTDWNEYEKNSTSQPFLRILSSPSPAFLELNIDAPMDGLGAFSNQLDVSLKAQPSTNNFTNTIVRLTPYIIEHNLEPYKKKFLQNEFIEKYNAQALKIISNVTKIIPEGKNLHAGLAAEKLFESIVLQVEGTWRNTLWKRIKEGSAKVFQNEKPEVSRTPEPKLVYNSDIIGALDGINYGGVIMNVELDLVLNQFCNSKVFTNNHDQKRGRMSENASCCLDYPKPDIKQLLVLVIMGVFGLFALSFRKLTGVLKLDNPIDNFIPCSSAASHLTTLFLTMVLSFLSDRTSLFVKTNNDESAYIYTIIIVVALVPGFLTLTLTPSSQSSSIGFLNKQQTYEWQGWMFLVILAIELTGASQFTSVYVIYRLLIASFLFIISFQQSINYLTLGRVAYSLHDLTKTIIDLNLVSLFLSYIMNRGLVWYYFGPLLSFWSIALWIILRIGYQWNSNISIVVLKLIVGSAISLTVIYVEGILEAFFWFLTNFFAVNAWDAKEARHLLSLDPIIAWIGVCVALFIVWLRQSVTTLGNGNNSFRFIKLWMFNHHHKVMVPLSSLTLVFYTQFLSTVEGKSKYEEFHPFVSFIPILAYVYLRNATSLLRRTCSSFWSWAGKFSLESFALQYHIWLAMDKKGVLVVAPGAAPGSMFLNFVVTSTLFLWVAEGCANGVRGFSRWFIGHSDPIILSPAERQIMSKRDEEPLYHAINAEVVEVSESKLETYKLVIRLFIAICCMTLLNYI